VRQSEELKKRPKGKPRRGVCTGSMGAMEIDRERRELIKVRIYPNGHSQQAKRGGPAKWRGGPTQRNALKLCQREKLLSPPKQKKDRQILRRRTPKGSSQKKVGSRGPTPLPGRKGVDGEQKGNKGRGGKKRGAGPIGQRGCGCNSSSEDRALERELGKSLVRQP